ncbi:response regulator [Geobacter sp. SVR]|uniref:response regulator n=1 Tax=Geobacter sp. SVR TaxID=2495594 RepID=UPI00143EFE72|nr:response regulator [Geobacter sp. SVR]BCS51724.1 response regulator [Geobacter sp. SVR]GCF84911.1 response regulator [Geobacter sp. SVR]
MALETNARELWVLGLKAGTGRETQICSYLEAGGYRCRLEQIDRLSTGRPLGIVLDISPFSEDGWGLLLQIKSDPAIRNIPILPVFLSETGTVGGVFPVGGFFTLPVDNRYLLERLSIYGLTEEAETWDLQVLLVSSNGEEQVAKAVAAAGFDVVSAYTGKEALALTSISPKYFSFCSLMLPDMSAFELLEKFRHYPYSKNTPMFMLLKEDMKEGEKAAISREIAHLVRKKELTCEEFLGYLRRRE